MTGQVRDRRRSVSEWISRGSLAIIFAALGYVGVAESLAYGIRSRDPKLAHAVAPWDGRISAALAQSFSGPSATAAMRTQANQLARLALAQDPTAVTAASTLALNIQMRGADRDAQRLMAYAQYVSRRDVASQIWLIENAVAGGDIRGALRHYDIALRTSPSTSSLLFPILTAAIADPAIRSALVTTVGNRPPWATLFLEYAAASTADLRPTALLLRDLKQKGYPVSELTQALLTDTLASRGLFDDAWASYALYRRGADRDSSRDGAFTAELANPTIFDWRPSSTAGGRVALQRGMLDFSAPATVGGALIEQAQMLTPGRYRLVGHSIGVDQPPRSAPYWQLRCQNGWALGRVEMPNSAVANGNFQGTFIVPADCPVQTLALIAAPSDVVSGLTGQLDHVRLARSQSDNRP